MVSALKGLRSVHKLVFSFIRIGEPGGLLFEEEPNKGGADEKEVCKLKMEEVLKLKSLENRSADEKSKVVVEVSVLKSKEELSKAERLSSFWSFFEPGMFGDKEMNNGDDAKSNL